VKLSVLSSAFFSKDTGMSLLKVRLTGTTANRLQTDLLVV
jgi:hypothetical protein